MSEQVDKGEAVVDLDGNDGEDLAVAVATAIAEVQDVSPAQVESIDGLDGDALTEAYQTATASDLTDIEISFCYEDIQISISGSGTVRAKQR